MKIEELNLTTREEVMFFDTDCGGVVHNLSYLRMIETCRTKLAGLMGMDLRTMAISRLMLDNIPHIKAYWIMLGQETAQLALSYGADDLDGTVVHELIYHDAGADTPEGMTVDQLHHLIREAGRDPVERDTLYRRVLRDGEKWSVAETA